MGGGRVSACGVASEEGCVISTSGGGGLLVG